MSTDERRAGRRDRTAPVEITPEEFRRLGHDLVDRIAAWLDAMPRGKVTTAPTQKHLRALLGAEPLPRNGAPPREILDEAATLLFENSLFNGHPRFWGYITSSATPVGALGDLLAAAVNPNVGAWQLSPLASELEAQTIGWLGELIGYPAGGGLLVSGGNMANFVGFLAARRAKATWDIRAEGITGRASRFTVYASSETHTWLQKAADLFGLGTNAIRFIECDAAQRIDVAALERRIEADRKAGDLPFLVIGAAGTVSTGAVDPLPAMADVCKAHGLWLHVDGAYGAPAAALPEASVDLKGLSRADSIALDPHKWLYSPLEAGALLVRNRQHLADAFSFHPAYYRFEGADAEPPLNYYEIGPQNSRGFRALKVWLGMRQAGSDGLIKMIRDDISLSKSLFESVAAHPDLQAVTQSLSIATFRYRPQDMARDTARDSARDASAAGAYLDTLNQEVLARLQKDGRAFVSNAIVNGAFALRACIVNFRTTLADVEALPEIVASIGREADRELRPQELRR